MVTVLQSIE